MQRESKSGILYQKTRDFVSKTIISAGDVGVVLEGGYANCNL